MGNQLRYACVAALLLCFTGLLGCNSASTTPESDGQPTMSAVVNGIAWSCASETVTAAIASSGSVITGSSESMATGTSKVLVITLPSGPLTVGEYRIDTLGIAGSGVTVQYREGVAALFQIPQDSEGYVRVTSISDSYVTGEFAFALTGVNITTGQYETRTFANGSFKAKTIR